MFGLVLLLWSLDKEYLYTFFDYDDDAVANAGQLIDWINNMVGNGEGEVEYKILKYGLYFFKVI